jgi:lysophospholipase L1-like esterase
MPMPMLAMPGGTLAVPARLIMSWLLLFAAPARTLAAPAWRIMPLGDSITLGVGSAGGYRCDLSEMLNGSAVAHTLVGPMSDKCGGHAGYNGNTLKQIAANIKPAVLDVAAPDVVALMGGTNDFFFYNDHPEQKDQLGANATGALLRLEGILDELYSWKPSLVVALSTTTHINATLCSHYHEAPWHPIDCPKDMPTNIAAFDGMLPSVVARQRAMNRRILLHDVNAEAQWEAGDWYNWGIHFSAAGYQKMAKAWHKALLPLAPKATSDISTTCNASMAGKYYGILSMHRSLEIKTNLSLDFSPSGLFVGGVVHSFATQKITALRCSPSSSTLTNVSLTLTPGDDGRTPITIPLTDGLFRSDTYGDRLSLSIRHGPSGMYDTLEVTKQTSKAEMLLAI